MIGTILKTIISAAKADPAVVTKYIAKALYIVLAAIGFLSIVADLLRQALTGITN